MCKQKFLLIVFVLFLSGCAGAPIRTHAKFATFFDNRKTITLMPIGIKIYQLTAGGVSEEMDEWENQVKTSLKEMIMNKFASSAKINIKAMDDSSLDNNFRDFLKEQNGLYKAVAESIIFHTYMPGGVFPNKVKNFDYSLGPELSRISEFSSTDSLLFISGKRTYWTGGRVMLATWGVLLGAVTGIIVVPSDVPDWIAVSLVDSKDEVFFGLDIWSPNTSVGDLRVSKIRKDIVDYLFDTLVR